MSNKFQTSDSVLLSKSGAHGLDTVSRWDLEYKSRGTIPSSRRMAPSRVLSSLFRKSKPPGDIALDLGCGNGRNSALLAEAGFSVVKSLDFSTEALSLLKENFHSIKQIESVHSDLENSLPFKNTSIDLALDSYCLCHLSNIESFDAAISEVRRVLQIGGLFLTIHVDVNDIYYKSRIIKRTKFGHISRDPINGFEKLHFSESSLKDYFLGNFEHVTTERVVFQDVIDGKSLARSVFASLFSKI
jgi:ubiquinone/menaquinone biosynthesis C-methylase UbiE